MAFDANKESAVNNMCPVANKEGLGTEIKALADRVAAAQADSTATDVTGLVADFNALLQKLRDAGLMASS